MLTWYRADLHIHTVLSACAELTMGPLDIVQSARAKNLDIIAITDHNSAQNVEAVINAARGTPLTVLPGMEVSSREEVHLICLFPDLDAVLDFQTFVHAHLRNGYFDEQLYGPQIICDSHENILHNSHKLLVHGIQADIETVADETLKRGGILYPAHIDRKAFSIYKVYEMLPPTIDFAAVEISLRIHKDNAKRRFPDIANYPLIAASDAHDIQDIGKTVTFFKLKRPTFSELVKAFKQKGGRRTTLRHPDR